MSGTLYVVATPLGNLDDLSPRAAATLKAAAAVAAEDTRHTKTLLAHVGSHAALVSFHAHSPDSALRRILRLLGTGKDVALVTDAGSPAVSDPGAVLVAAPRGRAAPGSRGRARGRAARCGSARTDESIRGDARRDPDRARGLLRGSPRPGRSHGRGRGQRQTRARRAASRSGSTRPRVARAGAHP